ncbi:MAG: hypothetical protein ACLPWF_13510 [Bryobacteraceae bacterium]
MKQQDTETLQEFSRILWGTYVWQVRLNIQYRFEKGYSPQDLDEFCLDFHEPLAVPEKVRTHRKVGSLWINVRNSGARLERSGKTLVASSDSVPKVLDHLSKMVGKQLVSIEIRPPAGDTRFLFRDDLALNCFPAKSRDGDTWAICTVDNNQLKLGPGSRVTYESGLR